MKLKRYNTADFFDSFEIKFTTGLENYYIHHEKMEERLLIFEAEIKEFSSLLEFGYACAYEQYITEKEFTEVAYKRGVYSPNPPYTPWDDYKKTFIEYPLPKELFGEKCIFCIKGLRESPKPDFDIISAMILKDEWNSVFIIAEYEDRYTGYWWKANF